MLLDADKDPSRELNSLTPSLRTRRNAHLTDDKEIEDKLAIGEFVRKGERTKIESMIREGGLLTSELPITQKLKPSTR